MMYELSKADKRIRRRIMHQITRQLSKGDPNAKAAFDSHYKDMVQDAITQVLVTERMASEALAAKLLRNGE